MAPSIAYPMIREQGLGERPGEDVDDVDVDDVDQIRVDVVEKVVERPTKGRRSAPAADAR